MFRLINKNTGEMLGYTNEVRYVNYDERTRIFFQAFNKETADGVAINGNVYNFGSEAKIPDRDFVAIIPVDEGEVHNQTNMRVEEQRTELTDVEKLILEQDNYNSVLEEALMELDNQVNS